MRFNSPLPKQFLELAGKPIIYFSLKLFARYADEVVLVLPQSHIPVWRDLCKSYGIEIDHKVAIGGSTRTESVKSGLDALKECNSVIAIHDAVRPLISPELIQNLYDAAAESNTAIPVIPIKDSLRKVSRNGDNEAVERSNYQIVQTPQVFTSKIVRGAYQSIDNQEYTDDASVVEQSGAPINICKGEAWNMKITLPEDLIVAEALISSSKPY